MFLRVVDNINLVRDSKSKAILNTSTESLKAYRAYRNKVNEMDKVKEEVETVKNDLIKLKNMIKTIMQHMNINAG